MSRPLVEAHESARPDDEAFRQLVESHERAVRVHCYRMLGSLQDAEDQTQETLLRAWRNLQTFEGRASMRAWLVANSVVHAGEPMASTTPRHW